MKQRRGSYKTEETEEVSESMTEGTDDRRNLPDAIIPIVPIPFTLLSLRSLHYAPRPSLTSRMEWVTSDSVLRS